MSRINDSSVYPISPIVPGSTWIGSLPNGNTVQYSESQLLEYVNANGDVVLAHKATRPGQVIAGNLNTFPSFVNGNINDGGPYLAEIINFPFTDDGDLHFLAQSF